jgi:hypothetical protein
MRNTKELHNLHSFVKYNCSDHVKEDEMIRACGMHGEKRNAYRILVDKPKRKRQLGRLKLKGNIINAS